jgi:hypothetical protein
MPELQPRPILRRESALNGFRVPANERQLVRVEGREDVGEILSLGVNVGSSHSVYCVAIHFPTTGECAYYAKDRVNFVDTETT